MAEGRARGGWPWWMDAVRELGFPIVVAWFLLWRVDRTLRDLTAEVHAATRALFDVEARGCVTMPRSQSGSGSLGELELGGLVLGSGFELGGCRVEVGGFRCGLSARAEGAVVWSGPAVSEGPPGRAPGGSG